MPDKYTPEDLTRDFKGVWIPKAVWLDDRLNALDKIILAEIDSLDQGELGCYASNKYIAQFCQCSETKVSTAISKLIEYGFLYVQSFDGRTRILKSRLSNFERQAFKDCKAGFQILKESNIDNNIDIKTEKKERKKAPAGWSYETIISEYTNNQDLQQALVEFVKMRKLIKKPLTDRALRLILSKLDTLASNDAAKIGILNQSIVNNWQGVFPLKDYSGGANQRQRQQMPERPETEADRIRREQAEQFGAMLAQAGSDQT